MAGTGDTFQQDTKYQRERMPRGGLDWASQPQPYKQYPDSPKVKLPDFDFSAAASLQDTISNRKSVRHFSQTPTTLEQLSYLLWASTGISRREHGYEFRTAPSAGALYPIETYLLAHSVEGAEQGIYHYAIQPHALESLNSGDHSSAVARAALDQTMCAHAALTFIWTAVFPRSKWKYKQRAYRYVYLDAGHIAENLALAATSIGLGTCQIAALYDDEANALIGVDGQEESVIYMTVAGVP